MLVTAEEDWMMPVATMPMSNSRKGFLTTESALLITSMTSECSSGSMESDITPSPTKISPSPASTLPTTLTFSLLANIVMNTPTSASSSRNAETSRLPKEAIHAVIVVPMLAPMITAVA